MAQLPKRSPGYGYPVFAPTLEIWCRGGNVQVTVLNDDNYEFAISVAERGKDGHFDFENAPMAVLDRSSVGVLLDVLSRFQDECERSREWLDRWEASPRGT